METNGEPKDRKAIRLVDDACYDFKVTNVNNLKEMALNRMA